MSKKPWIWSACRSIVSRRFTPATVSMFATTFAEIATRALRARRLQHEDVLAAHVLEELHHHLAVAEARDGRSSELDIQVLRHALRQPRIGVSREQHQVVEGHRVTLNLRIGRGGRIRTLECRN